MKFKILILFLVLSAISGCKFRRKIYDPVYTISDVSRIISTRSGTYADYNYNFNKAYYCGHEPLFNAERQLVKVGKRYYIKFSKSNPYRSELMFNWKIPDSILQSPKRYWETIPPHDTLVE